eukprot:gnl/TRDRNA2_/TRDRNA2_193268_c0_seq1.p1 gnl/TRDRNA2_/TRDRNA2_193268_c0~~gnl/TRDRNA2_/TRDRNA2_193268_c0_seq1.p1  ORF type:complete len:677 (+),score=141.44 gnl/TRDRNA2_/TRDRNA2_193268_c0_seq1:179-2209(+)
MEVYVSEVDNVPDGCLLSLSAGGSRRQAPLALKQKFAFGTSAATSASGHSGSGLKAEVLSIRGSARLPSAELKPVLWGYVDDPGASDVGMEGRPATMTVPVQPLASDGTQDAEMSVTLSIRPITSKDRLESKSLRGGSVTARSGGLLLEEPQLEKWALAATREDKAMNSSRRHHVALEAKAYLEDHRLLSFVEKLLRALVEERPQDPWHYIMSQAVAAELQQLRIPGPLEMEPGLKGAGTPSTSRSKPGQLTKQGSGPLLVLSMTSDTVEEMETGEALPQPVEAKDYYDRCAGLLQLKNSLGQEGFNSKKEFLLAVALSNLQVKDGFWLLDACSKLQGFFDTSGEELAVWTDKLMSLPAMDTGKPGFGDTTLSTFAPESELGQTGISFAGQTGTSSAFGSTAVLGSTTLPSGWRPAPQLEKKTLLPTVASSWSDVEQDSPVAAAKDKSAGSWYDRPSVGSWYKPILARPTKAKETSTGSMSVDDARVIASSLMSVCLPELLLEPMPPPSSDLTSPMASLPESRAGSRPGTSQLGTRPGSTMDKPSRLPASSPARPEPALQPAPAKAAAPGLPPAIETRTVAHMPSVATWLGVRRSGTPRPVQPLSLQPQAAASPVPAASFYEAELAAIKSAEEEVAEAAKENAHLLAENEALQAELEKLLALQRAAEEALTGSCAR